MNLIIFPAICVYLLIGAFFSKIAKTDERGDDLESFVWFIFWPIVIITLVIMSIIFLFGTVYIYIRNHFKR